MREELIEAAERAWLGVGKGWWGHEDVTSWSMFHTVLPIASSAPVGINISEDNPEVSSWFLLLCAEAL